MYVFFIIDIVVNLLSHNSKDIKVDLKSPLKYLGLFKLSKYRLTSCVDAIINIVFFLPNISPKQPANIVPTRPPKPNSDAIHDNCESDNGTPLFIGVLYDLRIKILDEAHDIDTPKLTLSRFTKVCN